MDLIGLRIDLHSAKVGIFQCTHDLVPDFVETPRIELLLNSVGLGVMLWEITPWSPSFQDKDHRIDEQRVDTCRPARISRHVVFDREFHL